MENCPNHEQLQRWLNRSNGFDRDHISEHLERCESCQKELERIADQYALSPPSADANAQNEYSDELSFQELRARLMKTSAPSTAMNRSSATPNSHRSYDNLTKIPSMNTATNLADSTLFSNDLANANSRRLMVDTNLDINAIPGFKIEKLIGSGGFASVYRAWDQKLGRTVAIKVLDSGRMNARNRHRFLREAKTASSVVSPNCVQVLSSGEMLSGQPFIVMELVRGQSLASWLKTRNRSSLPFHFQPDETLSDENEPSETEPSLPAIKQATVLLVQICRAVQVVHDIGLIHRDIKPGNIFVDETGSIAKLGDFGLARILEDDTVTLTRAAELTGTPAYMSPEQTIASSNVDRASDIYSLGATLYHILTGQPPFLGSTLAILKQVNENLPLPPSRLNNEVSRDLENICLKALEKEPSRRYTTAVDLALDLELALQGKPVSARAISPLEKTLRWARSNRRLAAATGLLLATLVAGTIVSTTLWRFSDYHATLVEQRNAELLASERELIDNQNRLIENSERLRESVRVMVSNTFAKKSTYLELSGDDRISAAHSVLETYQTLVAGDPENQTALREISTDLTTATETLLELGMFHLASEVLSHNQVYVDQLLQFPSKTPADYVLAAGVYNQIGECLLQVEDYAAAYQAGEAMWKVDSTPSEKAATAFTKALELATLPLATLRSGTDAPGSDDEVDVQLDLELRRLRAQRFLIGCESEGGDAATKLQQLLVEVAALCQRVPFSADGLSEHTRLLLSLSRSSTGPERIEYRQQCRTVYDQFNQRLAAAGQETFWFERNAAVNDFFLGIEFLKVGNVVDGRNSIDLAVEKMQILVDAFPRNAKFRADLAEAYLLIADIQWNEGQRELALESYDLALEQFDERIKHDSEDIAHRRRTAHVYEKVAGRLLAAERTLDAQECFQTAIAHMKLVIQSPFDSGLAESDKAAIDRMQQAFALSTAAE